MKSTLHVLLSILILPAVVRGQTRPDNFPVETSPTNSNFEFYTQKGGSARRATMDAVANYITPRIDAAPIAYTPTATGNPYADYRKFVIDPDGDLYYIDGDGDGMLIVSADPGGSGHVIMEGNTPRAQKDSLEFQSNSSIIFGASNTSTRTVVDATIEAGAVGAAEIASNAVDSSKISAGGVSVTDIGQHSATSGQVLKWNGTQWAPAADTDTDTGGDVGIINALDYGVVGDGVTDDVDSLQAAIDAAVGQRLWIPDGTYYISSSLTVASNTEIVMSPNATIDISSWSPAVTAGLTRAISISGSAGSTVNVTADIAIGDYDITITSTTGLAAGDMIAISSTEPLHGGYDRYKGWVSIVDSVLSSTVVRLSNKSYFAIDAAGGSYAAYIREYTPVENVKISGGKILGGGLDHGHVGIYMANFKNIVIEGVEIRDMETVAIWGATGIGQTVRKCRIYNSTSPTYLGVTYGYGVLIGSGFGAVIENNYFEQCRHSVSGGANPPSFTALIANNSSYDCGIGGHDIDCHESTVGFRFIGNSTYAGPHGGGGIVIRGTDASVIGNFVNGNSIIVANTVSISSATLGRTFLSGNTIRNAVVGIDLSGDNVNEISIEGGTIENMSTAGVRVLNSSTNVKVTGVSFINTTKAVYADSGTGLVVTGCTVNGGTEGVGVVSSSGRIIVANNVFNVTASGVSIYDTDNVIVDGNTIYGITSSSAVNFNRSDYGTITGNRIHMNAAGQNAIVAWGSSQTAKNFIVSDNFASGTYAYGLYCYSNADSITAANNVFSQAATDEIYLPGVTAYSLWNNAGQAVDHGDISTSGFGPGLNIDANVIDSTNVCAGCISITDMGQHGASTGHALKWNGTQWAGGTVVTSVAATAPAAGFTVSGSPITTTGTLTFALANDLSGVEGLSGTGIATRTATDTWTTRTITAGTGVSMSNGNGVSGNPTISVDTTVSNNLLPHGTSTYTLRHSGSAWTANNMVTNDGTTVGINSAPNASYQLHVKQPSSTSGLYVARNSSAAGVHLFHNGAANVASVGGNNLKLSTENSALINLVPGGGGGQISQIEIVPLNSITAVFGNTSCVNVNATYAPPTNGGDYSMFRIGGSINQHDSLTQRPRGLGIFPALTSVNAAGFFGIEYRPQNSFGEKETFLFQPIGAAVANRLAGDLYIGTDTTLSAAKVQILGDGNTSATYSLIVTNSGGTTSTAALVVRDDSRVGIGTNAPAEKLSVAGNVELTTAGNKLKIATGSNASMGTATLVAGTVTVSTTAVATGSTIFLTCNTPGGVQGFLSAPVASITNATSFVINSSNVADTSTVNWWIVN